VSLVCVGLSVRVVILVIFLMRSCARLVAGSWGLPAAQLDASGGQAKGAFLHSYYLSDLTVRYVHKTIDESDLVHLVACIGYSQFWSHSITERVLGKFCDWVTRSAETARSFCPTVFRPPLTRWAPVY